MHGEAVIQGIFFVFNYAYKQNLISYSYYRLVIELLNKYGFKSCVTKYNELELLEIMKKDKKASSDTLSFIVPSEKKKVKEIKLSLEDVLNMF